MPSLSLVLYHQAMETFGRQFIWLPKLQWLPNGAQWTTHWLPNDGLKEVYIYIYIYIYIYTDGSKSGEKVAAAAVTEQQEFKCRPADNASIFTVELKGIELALSENETTQGDDFDILSDFISSLEALGGDDWLNSMVLKVK